MSDSEIERLKRRVEELEKAQLNKTSKKPYQPPVLFRLFLFSQFGAMLFGGINGNLPIILLSILGIVLGGVFIFIQDKNHSGK